MSRRRHICLLPRYQNDASIVEAGVDEVARGCLFGPVYAAAVILNPEVPVHHWLNDSKLVTRKRRAVVRKWIEQHALSWSVASVDNDQIDKINIRRAAMLAMNTAVTSLKMRPGVLLIDGDYFNPESSIQDINYVTIVGGDAKYASIAAASILAKEHHDEYIRNMTEKEPELHMKYDVRNNVGYHTKKHASGLREHGISIFHRKTFLRKLLRTTDYAEILFQSESEEENSPSVGCLEKTIQ
jgi:ribonuclease HII